MKIIALTTNSGSGPDAGWHVAELRRAATAAGHAFLACGWARLVGEVGTGGPAARAGEIVLDEADVVLLRTMPPAGLEPIVFRMDLLQRLEAGGMRVINPPRAIELAVDKYLALARLQAGGLPVPPTIVCQRLRDAMEAFDTLGSDVVVKPLFGSEGFGMTRLDDPALAQRAFAMLERMGSVIYLQKFLPHDGDLRLFVLGGRLLAGMRRTSPSWKTNIAAGGAGEPFTADPALAALAVRAAAACAAEVAGVDILIGPDEQPYVLEVNACPGWRKLTEVTGLDVAAEIVAYCARERAEAPNRG